MDENTEVKIPVYMTGGEYYKMMSRLPGLFGRSSSNPDYNYALTTPEGVVTIKFTISRNREGERSWEPDRKIIIKSRNESQWDIIPQSYFSQMNMDPYAQQVGRRSALAQWTQGPNLDHRDYLMDPYGNNSTIDNPSMIRRFVDQQVQRIDSPIPPEPREEWAQGAMDEAVRLAEQRMQERVDLLAQANRQMNESLGLPDPELQVNQLNEGLQLSNLQRSLEQEQHEREMNLRRQEARMSIWNPFSRRR